MSFYWIFYIMFLLTLTCRNHIRRTESMKEVVIQNLIAEKQVKIWNFLNQYIFFLLVSLVLMLAFVKKQALRLEVEALEDNLQRILPHVIAAPEVRR